MTAKVKLIETIQGTHPGEAAAPCKTMAELLGSADLGNGTARAADPERTARRKMVARRIACQIAHGKTSDELDALYDLIHQIVDYVIYHKRGHYRYNEIGHP